MDDWFVSEGGFCLGDVGERVLDVSAAFRAILWLSVIVRQSLQQLEGFVECGTAAGCAVEDFSRYLLRGRLAGEEVCLNRIIDVGEVAALFAISKHGGLFVPKHERDELCQYAGVGR